MDLKTRGPRFNFRSSHFFLFLQVIVDHSDCENSYHNFDQKDFPMIFDQNGPKKEIILERNFCKTSIKTQKVRHVVTSLSIAFL